jgi:NAD(P)H-hydrate epimerase
MVKPFGEDDSPELDRFTGLLAGPGWGRAARMEILKRLLSTRCGGVLDADALTLFAEQGPAPPAVPWVLTPHPGEMARLTGKSKKEILEDPLGVSRYLADKTGCVVVLKAHVVFIVAPDGRFTVVDGMNAALGTGGSGDILAGIIAGFLSSGMEPYEAAWRGTALHQEAGKIQRQEGGWFLAEELLPHISRLLGKLGGQADE